MKRFLNTPTGKVVRFPLILAAWLLMPIAIAIAWWGLFWFQFQITEIVTEDW